MNDAIETSSTLHDVKYEIRGQLANHAVELERRGYEVISLNIGNGVSELIDLSLRALLNTGDEVLVPSPDYPLWSAAVSLNDGTPKYYDCDQHNGFVPDADQIESLITSKTRAIVVINPNNPSGAVYSRAVLQQLVALAEKHRLVLLADEIYDQMVYDDAEFVPMATLVEDTVCLTFSGLSKVYRACGYRVGWCVFSADLDAAAEFIHGMELLAALRLCANVPGQWAVQTALGGFQSIKELVGPGGRLDDRQFAQELLEDKHVLVAPGSSFNTPYSDHFRITTLPDSNTINTVFDRVDSLLEQHA